MPTKTHRSDYLILALLVVLCAVILLLFAWTGWLREDSLEERFIRSVYSTREDGVKAFYTLLEGQGIAVSTLEQPLQVEPLPEVGVLVSLNPIVAFNAAEVAELRTYLEQGLVLISTYVPDGLIKGLDDLLPPGRPLHTQKALRKRLDADEFKASSVRGKDRELALALDVNTVCMRTTTVIKPKNEPEDTVAGTALFNDTAGLRIAEYPVGAGRLVLISDSSFLANGFLGRRDNSVLAVNMVAHALQHAPTPTLVFDEYHLSYGSGHHGAKILGVLLVTTPAGWAILCLGAAGVLWLIYKGKQFGPRHNPLTETRRSKLDYIEAVGATLCAAKAHDLTLKLIYQAFRQRLAAHTALPPSSSNQVIIAELSRRTAIDAAKSEAALDDCDELLAGPSVSAAQLQGALRQLSTIETEIFHEH